MTYASETYYCEKCGCAEYSRAGNPLYGFEDKLLNMSVCADCLAELEEEKQERERVENELNEAA